MISETTLQETEGEAATSEQKTPKKSRKTPVYSKGDDVPSQNKNIQLGNKQAFVALLYISLEYLSV